MLAPLAKALRVSAPVRYYLALALLLLCITAVAAGLAWQFQHRTAELRFGSFYIALIVLLVQLAFFIGASTLKVMMTDGNTETESDSKSDSETDSETKQGKELEIKKPKIKKLKTKKPSANKDLPSRMQELDHISKSLLPRLRVLYRVLNRVEGLEAIEDRIKILEGYQEPFLDFFRFQDGPRAKIRSPGDPPQKMDTLIGVEVHDDDGAD